MKEWLMQNFDAYSIACVVTSIGSLVAAIVSLVKVHKANRVIADARSRKTQVLCPKCHKKSPIDEVHFILPDGAKDDNLNGVPDNQE